MTGRKISDTLIPEAVEARRDAIEDAATSAGVGSAYAWVLALGVQHAEQAAQSCALCYRQFFESGLPITFEGVEYRAKADLDVAIDAARATYGKVGA